MTYETKQDILNRVKEHYDSVNLPDYRKFGIVLMGSQNYGLADDESDIDTKMIVLPSLEELALNKPPLSHLKVQPNNEHTDLKDVRLFINSYIKQNPNMLETLYTEYLYINPMYQEFWNELTMEKEAIVRLDEKRAVNAMIGMMYEKQKALCHPYPTLKDKIDKYGYDGKQLSHAFRLHHMLQSYARQSPYHEGLTSFTDDYKQFLLDTKRNRLYTKEEAVDVMNFIIEDAAQLRTEIVFHKPNEETKNFLDDWLVNLLKFSLSKELI